MNLNVLFKAENIFLSCNIGYLMYKMIKRKQITHDEALSTFEIASKIPVRLVPVDILKTLELALEFNIYAYIKRKAIKVTL